MVEPDPALAAVKTYNYLRIALAALVLLLYTSVVLEWWAAGRCLQTSISAYYYTPVHAVFIGVLVTMGICLVALKGNTDGEDTLMNLAGMLAPGVAFIPTPGAEQCSSAPLLTPDIPAGVGNNMAALFVTGLVVGVFAVVIARRAGADGRPEHPRQARPGALARGAGGRHRLVLRRPRRLRRARARLLGHPDVPEHRRRGLAQRP